MVLRTQSSLPLPYTALFRSGVGEVDEERLVRLDGDVAIYVDCDRLRDHAGKERDGAAGGHVVGVARGGRAVGGGVGDRDRLRARSGERGVGGEGRRGWCAFV